MPLKPNRTRWNDALSRVDPTRFEALLANHYRGEGWRVEHVGAEATGRQYDGGIDLKLRRDEEYVIVQCKRWSACQVPHNDVHQLLGVMVSESATGAIFVTCGDFTSAALEVGRRGHVQLVDGAALRSMLDPVAIAEAERQSRPVLDDVRLGDFRRRSKRPKRPFWHGLIGPAVAVAASFVFIGFVVPRASEVFRPQLQRPKSAPSPERATRKPLQQPGHPINPREMVEHIIGAQTQAVRGNSDEAAAHLNAITNGVLRSARVPDASRPIDREAARAAVRPLPGVRSAVWLDRANFIVMVDGARYRNMAMIDEVCLALEPLGDTLAVVVNVQDSTATTADGATTLSRNCQLAPGQRAYMQERRQVDVISQS